MKNKILHLDEKDNVVVALDILYKGDKISFADNNIVIKVTLYLYKYRASL